MNSILEVQKSDLLVKGCKNSANVESFKDDLQKIEESGANEDIKKKYDDFTDHAEKQLESNIKSLEEQIRNIELSINTFSNKDPVSYWVDKFDEKSGVYLWRNHLRTYPFNIPFSKVELDLDEHTFVSEIVNDNSPDYEVWFSSGGKGKKACMVIMPILIGIPLLYGAMKLASHECKGTVTIYCKPKDIEPNIIPQNEKELRLVKKECEVAQLTLVQLKKENQTALAQKICSFINRKEKQIEALNSMKEYIQKNKETFEMADPKRRGLKCLSDEISSYNSIIRKLYLNISEKESISQFIMLYDKLITSNPISIDLIDIESLISNFNLLP